jgi:hypothetical protein
MAPAVMIIGAVISAVGALSQAQAASSAAKFNAKVAEQNAISSRQQGAAAQEAQRRTSEKQLGSMSAAYSASGVSMEGSPLDVLSESAGVAERDAQTIRYNYELKALGYENTASLEKASAKNAKTQGMFSAASSLMKGMGGMMGGGGSAVGSSVGMNSGAWSTGV